MTEILPYIIVIFAWSVNQPDERWLVERSLQPSAELCHQEGDMFTAEHEGAEYPDADTRYGYFCFEAPSEEEYNRFYEASK